MFRNFYIKHEGKEYQVEAKIFDNPSLWGIGNGRISKAYIYNPDYEGDDAEEALLWSYERGWNDDVPDWVEPAIMEKYPQHIDPPPPEPKIKIIGGVSGTTASTVIYGTPPWLK